MSAAAGLHNQRRLEWKLLEFLKKNVAGSVFEIAIDMKRGDLGMVIDGLGRASRGELTMGEGAGRRQVTIVQTLRGFGEPVVKLTLAAGLSTASKFDVVVQKGTELGVSRFIPLLTEKSKVRKPFTST